jgi:RHS repeat-associated protein
MAGGEAGATIITKVVKELLGDAAEAVERDAARDIAKAGARDAAEAGARDAARGGAATAARDAGEAGTREAAEDAGQDVARQGAREATEAGEDTAKQVGDRAATEEPIDIASGEVLLHQVDVDLPGVLPLELTRTHLSSYRTGRWFGRSWSSTLDQRLEVDQRGACLVGAEGLVLAYPVPMFGEPALPERGPRWPLSFGDQGYGDQGYTVTDREQGRTLHFAPQPNAGIPGGRAMVLPLKAIIDRNGNRIDLEYDAGGTLTEVRHSCGYRIGVRTAGGRITELRLLSGPDEPVLKRFGYDRSGRLTEVYNSSGRPTRFEYDAEGRLTRWVDTNDHWYGYTYDEHHRAVAGQGSGGYLNATLAYHDRSTVVTDSLGRDTVYHFNERGQVAAVVDPLGNTTWSEWDQYGRLLSRTDPLGRTTRYVRDENGDPTRIQRPDGTAMNIVYNALRLPTTVTGPNGDGWRYTYDERGNLTSVRDPRGATTRHEYNARGGLIATIDALGQVSRYECDAAGLPIGMTGRLGARGRLQRDAFGRVTSVTDALGAVSRMGWSVEGRPAWRIAPDGSREEWGYDGEGNLVEHRDRAGGTSTFEYGPLDVPTARTDPSGGGYRFAYDTELRLASVTNAQNLTWRYDYDAAGNLITETDFNDRTMRYRYDAAGQLTERVNGGGQASSYGRDALGRVVERRSADGGVHRFAYDPAGRLTRAESPHSTLEYVRDELGRILAETVDGRTLRNEYDALGRRLRRTTSTGAVSQWTYDPAGRPATLTAPGGGLAFQYDAVGQETARFLGPGAAISQTFDPSGRLATQAVWAYDQPGQRATARRLQGRTYTYRPDGRPVQITDWLRGDRRFDLDPIGRVTAVHGPTWSERYAYDALGNTVQAFAPGDEDARGDREYSGTLVRRAGRTTHEHDAQGRLVRTVRRTLSGQTRQWTYAWDADDRLVEATTPEGTWRYTYDPIGRRATKRRVGQNGSVTDATWFSWDGARLAEQVTTTPDGRAHAISWEWEPDSHRAAAQIRRSWALNAPQAQIDTAFYAIVTDLVGTPAELITPDGRVAWHHTTSLWGTPMSAPRGETDCPLRFPGQYHDAETGLNYNYFRYYDPATGGYASPDPIGLEPAPNHHAYVANPLHAIDAWGLAPYPPGAKENLGAADRASYDHLQEAVDRAASRPPDEIRAGMSIDQIEAGQREPYLQSMFAGSDIEKAVARDPAIAGDPNITHLGTSRPGQAVPDFKIGDGGYGVDVTGGSASSHATHMGRPYIDHSDQIMQYPTLSPDVLKEIFK